MLEEALVQRLRGRRVRDVEDRELEVLPHDARPRRVPGIVFRALCNISRALGVVGVTSWRLAAVPSAVWVNHIRQDDSGDVSDVLKLGQEFFTEYLRVDEDRVRGELLILNVSNVLHRVQIDQDSDISLDGGGAANGRGSIQSSEAGANAARVGIIVDPLLQSVTCH